MVDAPDGDLTPRAAWQLLSADVEAVPVDVRTRAEFLDELAAATGRGAAAAQAAAEAGCTQVFNVVEGFEGPLDSEQHRGTGTGWKVAGLPWRQS